MHTIEKNILVTGGAGYIGSHACKSLKKAGYNPVSYDNLVSGYQDLVKWGSFEFGDILDKERLVKVIEEYQPLAVMHFAAYIAAGESVENPGKYYQNNVVGSLTLLQAMQECGVKNIIFSSSATVYGNPKSDSIDESHPKEPINPYGTGKLIVEKMIDDYRIAHDFKYTILRYFNAVGADPEGETGCKQKKSTNLVPVIMEVLTGQRDKLEVFGTDYDTPDGTGIRDYIHVSDLADAHVLSLEHLLKTGESQILNLGTGRGYSVKEVINSAEKVTRKKVPCVYVPCRPGDAEIVVANASKAKKVLNWQPKYTEIDKMIESSWNWQIKNKK